LDGLLAEFQSALDAEACALLANQPESEIVRQASDGAAAALSVANEVDMYVRWKPSTTCIPQLSSLFPSVWLSSEMAERS
jgi:hypothetical protein